jgi:hypothetical protein
MFEIIISKSHLEMIAREESSRNNNEHKLKAELEMN